MAQPSIDGVHLWVMRERAIEATERDRVRTATLDPDERLQADQYRDPEARRLYIASRVLIRQALSVYRPDVAPSRWRFQRTSAGRPFVSEPPISPRLHFSLSHTTGLILLAVGGFAEIGVDTERLDRADVDADFARRVFSLEEADAIDAALPTDRRRRTVEVWTLKEAYVKALGAGLSLAFDQFSFDAPPAQDATLIYDRVQEDVRGWFFRRYIEQDSHCVALAMRPRSTSLPRVTLINAYETGDLDL
jgi:4'-phosphopantetheinyl transferase